MLKHKQVKQQALQVWLMEDPEDFLVFHLVLSLRVSDFLLASKVFLLA